jgi:amino acid adenylation domain-containing protein
VNNESIEAMQGLSSQKRELLRKLLEKKGVDLLSLPILRRPPDLTTLNSSFAQQRLWFLDQLEPGNAGYNMPAALRLSGDLNVDALKQTLDEVVRRHDVLRTTFASVDGVPIQAIAPALDVALAVSDLSALPEPQRERQVEQLVQQEAQVPFDLATGPLMRARLLRLSQTQHILLFTMHHIVSDGWSMGVLVNEVVALYAAYHQGRPSPLEPLSIQYADYAHWQRQWLSGEVLQAQIDYWKAQLAGAPARLALPTDRPRPAVQSHAGATEKFRIPPTLTAGLYNLAQQTQSTLFMVLTAAVNVLLWRYSAQEDICIGSPVANRAREELEPLIGCFVNTLVLRTRLHGELSFTALLDQVKNTTLDAYAHQDVPFEQLVDVLKPTRDTSYSPLFQVMVVLQNAPMKDLVLSGLRLQVMEWETTQAKFDLLVSFTEEGDELEAQIEYCSDLYEHDTIARMAAQLTRLLQGLVNDPQQSIARLPLLDEVERKLVLEQWNDTATPYPHDCTIHALFEAQVQRTPQAVAAVFEGQSLTYAELNAQANKLAHHLRALGVGPDVRVAICVERGLPMVVGLLAILKAGGAYVPLDPDYPAERLAYMLGDCQPAVLLTDAACAQRLPADARVPVLRIDEDESLWRELPADNLPAQGLGLNARHLVYVIYTSGSTGQPKGAMNEHRAVVNRLLWMQQTYGLSAGDTVLQKTPFGFDVSVWEFFWTWLAGARLVLAKPQGQRDPSYLLDVVEREAVTTVHFVPSMLSAFMACVPLGRAASLRRIVCSGEALPAAMVEAVHRQLPEARLYNLYGPTEAAVDVTAAEPRPGEPVTIGRPISNTRIYILDALGEPVPVGVPGEIYIAGVQVGRGYLNRPDLTDERFMADRYSGEPDARMYRTGDVGRWRADGTIEYLGRNDHQVKVRGLRIELGEIEACLSEQPGVREAVALAREDASGDKLLVAYVVAHEGQAADPAALREALQRRLPKYMVPAHFVMLDALPLTPNGKLDRRALPAPEGGASRAEYVAPRTPAEEQLVRIWAEVLGVEPIGVLDDFFDLGGHSLRTIEVLSRIRSVCAVDLPLRVLFEATTVEQLARHVEQAQPARAALMHIQPVEQQANYEVSAAQRRMWLLHQLDSSSTAYYVPALLDVPEGVECAVLEQALSEVLRRHEVLRTVFVQGEDGMPRQKVLAPWNVQLTVRVVDSEPQVREHFLQFMREPFDLARGPLFRGEFVRTPGGGQRLAWCMHEIIADGSSARILEREVQELLRAQASHEPARLPALPIQYKDYAAWQNSLLSAEDASRQYWHEQLDVGVTRLQLPYDWPLRDDTPAGAAQYQVAITGLAHEALVSLCRRYQVTVFMLLQASLAVWLTRLTGQRDIVVAVPTSGRDGCEAEPLIGFFLNTVLLRMQVEPGQRFEDVLAHAKEVALDGLQHQHYPFEQLIEELELPRPVNQFPVTPVLFNLLSFLEREPLGHVPAGHEALSLDAKAELELTAQEHVEGLVLKCAYRTHLFKPQTIEYLMQQWLSVLHQVSGAPGQPIETLAVFADEQARSLRSPYLQFANELPPAPAIEGVLARMARQAAQTPEAVAIEWRDRQRTYAQLEAHSNQIAHTLRQLGCGTGDVVALLLRDPMEHIAAVIGTMKAGGVFVTLDAADPLARLQTLAQCAQPSWWVAEHDTAAVLHELATALNATPRGVELGEAEVAGLTPLAANANPLQPPANADACYIFFTSGSTGQPKPILGRSQSLAQFIDWEIEAFALDQRCRVSQLTASTFDAFLRDVFVPLCAGGTVCVPPQPKLAPDELLQWLEASRVSHVHCVPSLLRAVLGYAQEGQEALPGLAALQRVCLSGEQVLTATVQAWHQAFGGRIELVNFYGASETTMIRCWHRITADDVARGYIPVGQPIGHTQAIVLDEHGQPCPPGVPGEIWLRSRYLTLGYYRDEARTAEVFVRNPLRPHDDERVYRSGDIGTLLDDGSLRCLGRRDGQVKVNGVRIEVGEVENALLAHPRVSEAAVVAQQSADGVTRLSAYVVAPETSDDDLRQHLAQRLPGTMLPQRISVLDALPLTSSGKVDRKALLALEDTSEQAQAEYVAPATDTERTVAELYGQVLGRERVGRDDDFFALGGHSLQALMVLARVRKALNVEVALRSLFEERTVQRLAKVVDELIAARQQSGTAALDDVLAELLQELDEPSATEQQGT